MNTQASNRTIRQLITAIQDGAVEIRPGFQRRRVWGRKEQRALIQTIIEGLPFPEIFLADASVDLETAASEEVVVDGQQRLEAIVSYFGNEFRGDGLPFYSELKDGLRRAFLRYDVVVRNLGECTDEELRSVYARLNSTSYDLQFMEIAHAKYDGELKRFGAALAADPFFDRHSVFNTGDYRRMRDVEFSLTYVVTLMSGYFNRTPEIEPALAAFNDGFDADESIGRLVRSTLDLVDAFDLPDRSRAFRKADMLTLLVEVSDRIRQQGLPANPTEVGENLNNFYARVDLAKQSDDVDRHGDAEATEYYLAALQAANDRSSRQRRGRIVSEVLGRAWGAAAVEAADAADEAPEIQVGPLGAIQELIETGYFADPHSVSEINEYAERYYGRHFGTGPISGALQRATDRQWLVRQELVGGLRWAESVEAMERAIPRLEVDGAA